MIRSINVTTGQVTESQEDAPTLLPDAATQLARWRARARVSRFQAFAALDAAGLLDEATAAVTAAGGKALLAWNNAIEFRRNSPTINALFGQLNLTPEQLDALFIAAAEIDA
jgi:hypothetical protein